MLHTSEPSVFNRFRMSLTLLPLEIPPSPSGCPNCRKDWQAAARSQLLARAASLGSLLASVPPHFRCSRRRIGCFCSADLLIYRRYYCMWSWVTCLRDDPGVSFLDREAKGPAFHSHKHALQCEDQIHLLPSLTSAPLFASFPTLKRGLLTSLRTKGV